MFLVAIPSALRRSLGKTLGRFHVTSGPGLVKFSYGNPKLHYEANLQSKSRTIEIGLHFEADAFTNTRLLGAFRIHQKRIRKELPGARLDEWDKGWARIWEPLAYEQLDAALQRAVAERLALYVSVLEPLLREELPADVPWYVGAKSARTAVRPKSPSTSSASTRRARAPR